MAQSGDTWYVRFPDGRVVRAAAKTIRRQLGSGRVPFSSTVRRSPEDEWVLLEWTEEFRDLIQHPPAVNGETTITPPPRKKKRRVVRTTGGPIRVGARLDSKRFRFIGARGIFREMMSALDSTTLPKKLTAAAFAGAAFAALAGVAFVPWPDLGGYQAAIPWGLGLAAVLVFALLSSVLTRMVFVELSELRPARKREGLKGAAGRTVRLLAALLFEVGGVVLLLAALRYGTGWLLTSADGSLPAAREAAANVLAVANLVFEFVLAPLFVLSLLLSPLLVVEECSVFRGLRMWRALVRTHFRTVLAYETAAVAVAAAITLPFALPLLLSAAVPLDERLVAAATVTRAVLWGFLLALPAAYLIVANVYIYLNVRYETATERRA
jgi:hypothetical protein